MCQGLLACLLFWHLGALLACLRQANRDGLFPALYGAALATFSGFESSRLFPVDRALYTFACSLSILCHVRLQSIKIQKKQGWPTDC